MARVDKYFLDRAKDLSFIELKKGSKVNIKGYELKSGIPLPIITEVLLEDIRQGAAEDEISILNMIHGIIYLFGTDPDFIHNDLYKDILLNFDENIEGFILYNALEYMKKEDYIKAAIYIRAILYLKREDELALFNYSMALENIARKLGNQELIDQMILEATNSLEEILNLDSDFALAYYKLGYHYKYTEQFVKAKLIWEKYLELEDDIERQNEVREELSIIDVDVNFEEAILLLAQGQFSLALEKLLKIEKLSDWWNIDYLIGLCYKNLNRTEEAIEYLEEAIEKGGKEAVVYNELAISYFTMGYADRAVEKLNKAIELDSNNFEYILNRGIIYQQLGLLDEAREDYEHAYKINPDDTIKEHLEDVRRLY